MTTEATVTKLSYLMGKGFTGKELTKYMETNLRGELTPQSEIDEEYILFRNRQLGVVAKL